MMREMSETKNFKLKFDNLMHFIWKKDFKNIDDSLDLQKYSYETMEFLGDSILSSIISSYLYERFYTIYEQNEGFLTKLKIRFVCGEQLAFLSRQLEFNKYMILSKHI